MSMLAEKRQKKAWILNPKSTAWTEDSNKFGQKMLEKMGWTPGKGLGVNEQGMVNALRVKYKSDLKGLGCEEKVEDWIKTQEEFNTLLGELGGAEDNNKVGKKSLEQTSKKIRNRVHYHKFTRGKDLTTYSAKDLESILGTNSNNSSNTEHVVSVEDEVSDSIYANFKKKGILEFNRDILNTKETELLVCNSLCDEESNSIKRKRSKNRRRKLSEDLSKNLNYEVEFENNDELPKSKKKKKKKKGNSDVLI